MLELISEPTSLSAFAGVDVTSIRWLYASERTSACSRHFSAPDRKDDMPRFGETFGRLRPLDTFYLSLSESFIAPRSRYGDAYDSGHIVAIHDPATLLQNVMDWLAERTSSVARD